ncbi:MAG: regulatory protein RecX [Clostridium sp.]|jgi:regulatory protein|nr:regulatory protein RecX [Clostridium sp.]
MHVDKIEPLDRRRSRVFLDGDFAFALYNGEIRRYRLEEGQELEKALYEQILREIVCRRARERALFLLKDMDRTEHELRARLKRGWYPDSAIEETMAFLKEYHYVDDLAYARKYMEAYGEKKSRAQLMQSLWRKGIDRAVAEELYNEARPDTAKQIQKLLRKKGYTGQPLSREEKGKLAAYLMRRGFSWEESKNAFLERDEYT